MYSCIICKRIWYWNMINCRYDCLLVNRYEWKWWGMPAIEHAKKKIARTWEIVNKYHIAYQKNYSLLNKSYMICKITFKITSDSSRSINLLK